MMTALTDTAAAAAPRAAPAGPHGGAVSAPDETELTFPEALRKAERAGPGGIEGTAPDAPAPESIALPLPAARGEAVVPAGAPGMAGPAGASAAGRAPPLVLAGVAPDEGLPAVDSPGSAKSVPEIARIVPHDGAASGFDVPMGGGTQLPWQTWAAGAQWKRTPGPADGGAPGPEAAPAVGFPATGAGVAPGQAQDPAAAAEPEPGPVALPLAQVRSATPSSEGGAWSGLTAATAGAQGKAAREGAPDIPARAAPDVSEDLSGGRSAGLPERTARQDAGDGARGVPAAAQSAGQADVKAGGHPGGSPGASDPAAGPVRPASHGQAGAHDDAPPVAGQPLPAASSGGGATGIRESGIGEPGISEPGSAAAGTAGAGAARAPDAGAGAAPMDGTGDTAEADAQDRSAADRPAARTRTSPEASAASAGIEPSAAKAAAPAPDPAPAGPAEAVPFDPSGSGPLQAAGSVAGPAPAPPPGLASAPHLPADIAAGVARQIAIAVTTYPDRPVEIVLSPEELGMVRMTLSTAEGAVALTIWAERPETIDLMRRHADALAQEFRDLGFGNVNLAFGRDGAPGHDGQPPGPAFSAAAALDAPAADVTPPARRATPATPEGRIDIRI